MELGLGEVVGGWPLVSSLVAAVGLRGLRTGRRRASLNEALHELRRPLQALALAAPGGDGAGPAGVEHSVQMAAVALRRLDCEINGTIAAAPREPLRVDSLLRAAVARWRRRAALGGGSLQLGPVAAATVLADRDGLARALDNLVVNAIEHGGPAVSVRAERRGRRLCLVVADSGGVRRVRRRRAAESIAGLGGHRRHGHGLRVVKKVAAAHGGCFELRRTERGCEAVLSLPALAGEGA